mmetsp:Transcript_24064/g.47245  ORF Transcript_24064/g.47245 Transcript_24064/m.47245 type:complete len:546 (+) Transcript_24064:150-1787(+)
MPEKMVASTDPQVNGRREEIEKSRREYEKSVVQQYDTDTKRKFYSAVMGDGTDNIHFGKWEGVDVEKEGAYGEASARMTDWMWKRAMSISQKKAGGGKVQYIDLGSGTGAAARLICKDFPDVSCTCLNLCENQNAENMAANTKEGVDERVEVCKGSYMELPSEWDSRFDGCFSQDAFVHAFSKYSAFTEALRVTKDGGWLVFSDLMKGEASGVSEEELESFGQTNMVADWLTPTEVCKTLTEAGWSEVCFEDLTLDIKCSFQLMLKKVNRLLSDPQACKGIDLDLLETYRNNLAKRVGQVDRGVFKWGCISARKPYNTDEGKKRADLATAHNITRKFGMDELVWNHMSSRLQDGGFLITPGGLLFDEITPHDLHKSSTNITADIIHAAVYDARPDVNVVIHLHTPASVAVSCLDEGFVPLAQEAAPFYNKVAVHEWEGLSDDLDEKPRLMEAVKGDSRVLLMRHHGFCTLAKTVAEAWVLAYYFDKSCRTQLEVMKASGGKLRRPPASVMEKASQQIYLPEFAPGVCEWEALKRLAARGQKELCR